MDLIKETQFARWAEEVKSWKESGLRQVDWCEEHNINVNTFRYRMRVLKQAIAEKQNEQISSPVTFMPLPEPVSSKFPVSLNDNRDNGLVIEISGVKIAVGNSTDMNQLKNVLEVLEYAK